jgi:hypothetical protein
VQGTLAQLDTRNPVLYIDFPEGRLKLLGTLAFPRNKYMVLKLGAKEALCEDVLESMVRSPALLLCRAADGRARWGEGCELQRTISRVF